MAWSGLYDNEFTDGPHALQINPGHAKPSKYKKIAKILKKAGYRLDKQLIDDAFEQLEGVTKTAVSYGRVEATSTLNSVSNLGGSRTIETVSVATTIAATAAEETQLENITTHSSQPSSYPVDASGNGGGGKQGY